MRWFVSRNGETVGPVEEAELAGWVRGGMADASVRDEEGGNWMPVAQSPFAQMLPGAALQGQRPGRWTWLVVLAVCAVILRIVYASFEDSKRTQDAEFCAQNLSYYENFCTVYPANCQEGARKLARCE